MRDFNNVDRLKKDQRIKLPENPANLPEKTVRWLEGEVKLRLKNGYLSCPTAWKIARDAGVPRIAVGAVTDSLGVRVTDCQLGCFKVDKTPFRNRDVPPVPETVMRRLASFAADGSLTCYDAFQLARELGVKPAVIADAVNLSSLKIYRCQLGCF